MTALTKERSGNIFLRMHPLQRIVISLALTAVTYFLLSKDVPALIMLMSLWIIFSTTFLITSWIILFTKPVSEIRKSASKEDGSKPFVFLMILLSSCASMFTVLLLLVSKDSSTSNNGFYLPATICGMMLSWIMVHTLFAFHYAHDYYGNDENDKTKPAGGLEFPGKNTIPDYIDFAYFSFVIGCTFQVSDVEISSRKIRRLVFLHQLISFGLNTFVVALTINLIAGLSK